MKFFGRKNKPEDEINKELNQVLKKLEVDSEIENNKIEKLLEFITKTKKGNIDFLNINLEELIDYLNELQDEIRERIEFSSQKSNQNIELSQELIKINKITSLLMQYSQMIQKDLKDIKVSELINFALHRKDYLKQLLDLK
ncbi:MAG: hypothetical protein QXY79_04465 [Candidatus Methanomethylicia archaeon]